MQYITIKKDDSLKIILDFIKKDASQFIFTTLNYLEVNEWIADASDEWGKTIGQILDESEVDSYGAAILALKTNMPTVVEAFRNLVIVGYGDCPECGADLERFNDGNYGKEWEVERCTCGYYASTEPAWDESYEDN